MKKATPLSHKPATPLPATFTACGLDPKIVDELQRQSLAQPSEVQARAIPTMLQGSDLVAISPTASGKTLAYTLPILHELAKHGNPSPSQQRSIYAVVLTPTRELAHQVAQSWQSWAKALSLQVLCFHGGDAISSQQPKLRRGADLLVATPGRLLQLMQQRPGEFRFVNHVIFDEADKMLDKGLLAELKKITQLLPRSTQKSMFSATWPKELNELAKRMLKSPQFLRMDQAKVSTSAVPQKLELASKVDESLFVIPTNMKADFVQGWLQSTEFQSVIIFVEQKTTANRLYEFLSAQGITCARIHADRNPRQRERAMEEFRSQSNRVLIATDLIARGIHVPSVSHVIHFDLALNPEDHVHRVGRAGREGSQVGISLTLVSAKDRKTLAVYEEGFERKLSEAKFPNIRLPKRPSPSWLALLTPPVTKKPKPEVVEVQTRRGEIPFPPRHR